MSHDDQIRWDHRYGENEGPHQAAAFLREIFDSNAWDLRRGRALDIACGSGRNALFLAEKGFAVTGIDISQVALDRAAERAKEKSLLIVWQQADLELKPLPVAGYDLIVDIDYLQRSLFPQIKATLKSGGFLIFETYLTGQQAIGHPRNPNYLLAPNELLDGLRDFRVLYYREGKFMSDGAWSFRAGILAKKIP